MTDDILKAIPDAAPVIPSHIAGNICEMLKRVQVTGMEAIAWAEAFGFMQKHAPQGVPFTGIPQKKSSD
jgi:hypothetical protein